MFFHPTALLSGLLLVLLAADLRDVTAIAQPALRSGNLSAAAAQLANANVQTFHRGSGRRQLSWESNLLLGV